MARRRSFLVPIGVAVAALGAKAGFAEVGMEPSRSVEGGDRPIDPALTAKWRQRLVAAPRARGDVAVSQAVIRLAASLTVGQEVPRPRVAGVGAAGRFTATLSGRTLSWRMTFSRLSGPATGAAVHRGRRGQAGAGMFRLCSSCASPKTGTVVLTQSQVSALLSGGTYVRISTRANPGGEVRGQIGRQVPSVAEPIASPPVGGHFSHVSHQSHSSHVSHSSHSSSSY